MAMGRYPEAESVYSLLARGAPSMGGAWYGLGVAQTQQGRFEDAVASLQQACRHQARDPRAWLQLSRACAGAGMTTEAEKAFEKGKQLNPAMAEHFRPDSAATPAP